MTDFIREVEEELRNDKLKDFWNKYGVFIILAVVLIVGGTAALRGYDYWKTTKAASAGDEFLGAISLLEDGKEADAISALSAISESGEGGYPALAKFRLAAEQAKQGNTKEALTLFEQIATDAKTPISLKDFALIRSGLLAVDVETPQELASRLGSFLDASNPWRHLAREAMALSYWKAKDVIASAKMVAEIADDQETPQGVAQRITMLRELIISNGVEIPTTKPAE